MTYAPKPECVQNLLGQETSPYLVQHASNPVHWFPWGAKALDRARRLNRPILLSIGYSACHWCHVMAHEAFEDETVATLMNREFVNIKVDREERPDIDHIYMTALNAFGEQGGWPLTMFLTPNGAPFWGGTYFPPQPRWGLPSFAQVLIAAAQAYAQGDIIISRNTQAVADVLARDQIPTPGDALSPSKLSQAAYQMVRSTDPIYGGLRGTPKFPNAPMFRFLWQQGLKTGSGDAIEAVHLLLTRMCRGGIFDQLGGGFARYSTDEEWLVPHFEKMLYDNAQILELLAVAYAHRSDPLYSASALATVDWLCSDMLTPNAGGPVFAAAEDADSEGIEGNFYVWSEAEIEGILGPASAAFKSAYDVREGGNWEGLTILRRVTSLGDTATEADLSESRARLLVARNRRVRPLRDDKVLADWNAMMVTALCRASAVFGEPGWLQRAQDAFDWLISHLCAWDPQNSVLRCNHAWRLGRTTAKGLLEDQVAMARAALALHEATGDGTRLAQAQGLVAACLNHFADQEGAFFQTADDVSDMPPGLGIRPRHARDGATPSGNGMLAEVFARLSHLTGDAVWHERAERLIRVFSGDTQALGTMPTLLSAAELLRGPTLVAIVGDDDNLAMRELCKAALACGDPLVILSRVPDASGLPTTHPAYGKQPGAAYVCRGQTCSLPIHDPIQLTRALLIQAL